MAKLMKNVVYEERVLSFIDILGFSDLIKKSENDESLAVDVLRVWGGIDDLKKKLATNSSSLTMFSDCMCVSQCISGSYFSFYAGVCLICLGLIGSGYPVRGAISRGKLYHQGNVIFGPCLVRAYQLESKLSFYPRIIVDPQMIVANGDDTDDLNLIVRDEDGVLMLNYLSQQLIGVISNITNMFSLESIKRELKSKIDFMIQQSVQNKNPFSEAKLGWLYSYASKSLFNSSPDYDEINRISSKILQEMNAQRNSSTKIMET